MNLGFKYYFITIENLMEVRVKVSVEGGAWQKPLGT